MGSDAKLYRKLQAFGRLDVEQIVDTSSQVNMARLRRLSIFISCDDHNLRVF